MTRVLVTGTGGGVGQGILKCLRMIEGMDLEVIAADMSSLAPGLYAGDRAVLVPAARDPGYVDHVVDYCEREQVEFYLPGTDVELATCARARSRFAAIGCQVAALSESAIEIADDKFATARFLADQGLAHPETWLAAEVRPDALSYPVIVKPRRGFRSIGVERVDDAERLRAVLASRQDEVIVQAYAGPDDREYTCTIVGAAGELSPVVVLRRDLRAGDTFRAWPVRDPLIEDYVRDAARALGVTASCNFQLRSDGATPKIFEINARFSGTTPFCARLGLNPVEFWIKRSLGLPCEVNIRTDVVVLRAWSEMVVRVGQLAELDREGFLNDPVVDERGVL